MRQESVPKATGDVTADTSEKDKNPEMQKIAVVITEMPQTPSKPLLKDSTRLISLAAFIFSLMTGGYTIYTTIITQRETNIDNIAKLIAQYYEYSGKLQKIDSNTQTTYWNLLKTQQRSVATRGVTEALKVPGYLDVGVWMSLAQINDDIDNYKFSEMAWKEAITNASLLSDYTFGLRTFAASLWKQNRMDEVRTQLEKAIEVVTNGGLNNANLENNLHQNGQALELINIHLVWMAMEPITNCAAIESNYKSALAGITEISPRLPPNDPTLKGDRDWMNGMRQVMREKCGITVDEVQPILVPGTGLGPSGSIADHPGAYEVTCGSPDPSPFSPSHNPVWGMTGRPSCALVHVQDKSHQLDGWIRGWAKVGSTGRIDVVFELETDRLTVGPCGKADAELWGRGQQLAHAVLLADPNHGQRGACRGGKAPSTHAQASLFSYQASVEPNLAAQVDRINVTVQYLGISESDKNIKAQEVVGVSDIIVNPIISSPL